EGARMRPMARSLWRQGDVASVAEYVATLPARVPAHAMVQGDTAAGRVSYQSVCIACHQEDGTGNEALGAPPLTPQHAWYMLPHVKLQPGARGAHPDHARGARKAAMPQRLADRPAMENVVAYIRTLQKESPHGR